MGSSPSHNTAADSSSIKCDVCQRQNKTSTAVSYCKDCEETLCQICDNVHRNSKVLQNHTFLTGEHLKQIKSKCQLLDTDNTKPDANTCNGQVNDTTNNSPSAVINDAGEVQGHIKDTKSDGNSVPGRTKDTTSDSNNAVGGVKVGKHNPDSVPGRVKDTQVNAGALSGRVVDKNNDQSSIPGRVKDTQKSVPGRKLDSSSKTYTVPSVLDLTVSPNRHYDVDCTNIQSVVFMPRGHVVLACAPNGLKLLDKEFKQLSQLSLPVACACKVSDKEVLVSQGGKKKIQFVRVLPKMVTKNILTIGKVSSGVCYHNGEIYVACRDNPGLGEVRVVDRKGTLIRRLGVHDGMYMFIKPWDVKVNNAGDKVFVTDGGTHSVTCLDQTGQVLYKYTDTDLMWPGGILVDSQDNVLVTANASHNVHVINSTGRKNKIVLTRKYGRDGPLYISYRHNDGLLALGMLSKDGTRSFVTLKSSLSSD